MTPTPANAAIFTEMTKDELKWRHVLLGSKYLAKTTLDLAKRASHFKKHSNHKNDNPDCSVHYVTLRTSRCTSSSDQTGRGLGNIETGGAKQPHLRVWGPG